MLIFKLVLVQCIVFAAIVFVLKKLIFTDTNSALNRLNDARVSAEQKEADLVVKMKKCEDECRRQVTDAEKKAEEIKMRGIQEAENQAKEIVAKARKQSEELVHKANESKEKLRESILQDVDVKVIDFSVKVVRKAFADIMSEDVNGYIADQFVKQLESVDDRFIKDVESGEILSPFKLSAKTKDTIISIVRKKIGRDIAFTEKIDTEILGGVVLKFGTLVLDWSLIARLKDASDELKKIEGQPGAVKVKKEKQEPGEDVSPAEKQDAKQEVKHEEKHEAKK